MSKHEKELPTDTIKTLFQAGPCIENSVPIKKAHAIVQYGNVRGYLGFLLQTKSMFPSQHETCVSENLYDAAETPSMHIVRREKVVRCQERFMNNSKRQLAESKMWMNSLHSKTMKLSVENASEEEAQCDSCFDLKDSERLRTMFLYRIPKNINEERIHRELLKQTNVTDGKILKITLIKDILSSRSRGYCFVIFATRIFLIESMRLLKGFRIDGHAIGIDVCRGGLELHKNPLSGTFDYANIPQRLQSDSEKLSNHLLPYRKRIWPTGSGV